MWEWLKRSSNREVLTWLGSGIASVAIAGWALFTYFDGGEDQPASPQTVPAAPSAEAGTGIANTGTQVFEGDVDIGGEPTQEPE